jgi:hypothetical protein
MSRLTKAFFEEIRQLIRAAHATVARGVDLVQVHTNFEIGRRIVEQEQKGKGRAAYGEEVIGALAERLTGEFGKGFSASNLAYMRSFYLLYRERAPIFQSATGKLAPDKNLQSVTGKSAVALRRPFMLSWTHYTFLLGIKNPDERSFYEGVEMGTLEGFPNPPAMVRSRRSRLAPHAIRQRRVWVQGANIHAREHRLCLPSKEELQRKLVEWAGKAGNA